MELLAFAAYELADSCRFIGDAITAHIAGEELPPPRHSHDAGTGQVKTTRRRKDPRKPKRQPTAFHIFVKHAIEALKVQGTVDPANQGGSHRQHGLCCWRSLTR